jgi:Acetyltransferases, including N-acetylases of ribosomal proteins
MADFHIGTERLVLRAWRGEDVPALHAICSDPLVMETLGPPLTYEETEALVGRMQGLQADLGHCFWAMERREDARLIGWCGIIRGSVGPVAGKPEAGWRMTPDCWGKGYVSEAAQAAIGWAFANLVDPAVYAITNVDNRRSRAVMERMGMMRLEDGDFDHPKVDPASPLVRHVTYRVTREEWGERSA